jgi:peptidoglycan/LPS O-acetylase OafA/YrhL
VQPARKYPIHIPTLDGWRAIAISMVMLHHAVRGMYPRDADYWNQSWTLFGAFGVDVFFGLSGLLITKLLLDEARQSGTINLRAFYIRRGFRILPPCLVLLLAVALAGLIQSRLELASCLFFFRNYIPAGAGSIYTAHLWSLAVEEHFYLIWPGLLLLCGVKRGRPIAMWLAIGIGLWRVASSQAHYLPDIVAHFRSDLRMDALLWGCAAAFLLDLPPKRFRLVLWLGILLATIVCLNFYSLLTGLWLAILIPLVLAGTAMHPEWVVSRALEWTPMRWVGRISYGLYLWQQIFLIPGEMHPTHAWQRWPWNLLATFLVAGVSYYAIERPLLRVGRRLAARSSSTAANAAKLVQEPVPVR